jgi:predicted TPR repeat methyltransferase
VDSTGKISLDHIYTQPDPRDYFTTLRKLDYHIPQLAKPYFADLIGEYRESRRIPVPTVLDIGCSYGINAALLKCDATMDELYQHYDGEDIGALPRSALLDRDRELVRSRGGTGNVRFMGLDASQEAVSYALESGFLESAVHADLEESDPTEPQRGQLAETDIIISTGCFGYVTERTLSRVIQTHAGHRPWMAHFVLRMFPFESAEAVLGSLGYETVSVDRLFKQRRFATSAEQSLVLDTLSTAGVDPQGLETEGWLYAQLHLSRPRQTKRPDRGLN